MKNLLRSSVYIATALLTLFIATPTVFADPLTSLHYTASGNFNGNTYSPGAFGFNLVDVSSPGLLPYVPAGAKALVFIGQCDGVTPAFTAAVSPYSGQSNVWGFYLFDDAYATSPTCPLSSIGNLKAESDYIHANVPGAKVFIELANGGPSSAPSYMGYNSTTTGADYLGIAAYPCRSELNGGAGGCDYTYINKNVAAATAAGIPTSAIIPIYQTFGGGNWIDDMGGSYVLPTATQEQQILATWGSLVPSPVFDYAYHWGQQNNDISLATSSALQVIFFNHNTPPLPTFLCRNRHALKYLGAYQLDR
jgi:hypothetical protein